MGLLGWRKYEGSWQTVGIFGFRHDIIYGFRCCSKARTDRQFDGYADIRRLCTMKKLCIILVTLVTFAISSWAVDITLTFTVSASDKTRILTALEQKYARLPNETDLAFFKRVFKLYILELTASAEAPVPVVTVPETPTPPDIQ
jgi:hypothetical protein